MCLVFRETKTLEKKQTICVEMYESVYLFVSKKRKFVDLIFNLREKRFSKKMLYHMSVKASRKEK